MNAALNGAYGVPIALVTGDAAVCRETKELLGDELPTVAVKKGLSRFSARQLPLVHARQLIEDATKAALTAKIRQARQADRRKRLYVLRFRPRSRRDP